VETWWVVSLLVVEDILKQITLIVIIYDPSKPTVYITYFDANNLYGGAMSEVLTHLMI
jgi:hypothetical protein